MPAYLEVWGDRGPHLVVLEGERTTIGRGAENDIALTADQTVSALHAVVDRYASGWCVRDLGSANGTYVNSKRVGSERRLRSGDEIRLGDSRVIFRVQGESESPPTVTGAGPPPLTRRERDVLTALCRPLVSGDAFTQPATVREMAGELVVSEAAIKTHLFHLYDKFAIHEHGDSRRALLANEALRRRAVTIPDLTRPPS